MISALQFAVIFLPIILLIFWIWMFSDMLKNNNLPACFITFSNGNNPRFGWMCAFILLTVLTAVVYYVKVYK